MVENDCEFCGPDSSEAAVSFPGTALFETPSGEFFELETG
jgi:hypothetical protein